jgi:hypothetical protein
MDTCKHCGRKMRGLIPQVICYTCRLDRRLVARYGLGAVARAADRQDEIATSGGPLPPRPGPLLTLLQQLGEWATFEQVRNHLAEDGIDLTRADYDQARATLQLTTDKERRAATRGPPRPRGRETPRPREFSPPPNPNTEDPSMPPAPALNRLEVSRRIKDALQKLGPTATFEEVQDEVGPPVAVTKGQFWRARACLGFRGRTSSARGSATKRPALSASANGQASSNTVPHTVTPSSDVASRVESFLLSVQALGGPAVAKRILSAIEAATHAPAPA